MSALGANLVTAPDPELKSARSALETGVDLFRAEGIWQADYWESSGASRETA